MEAEQKMAHQRAARGQTTLELILIQRKPHIREMTFLGEPYNTMMTTVSILLATINDELVINLI